MFRKKRVTLPETSPLASTKSSKKTLKRRVSWRASADGSGSFPTVIYGDDGDVAQDETIRKALANSFQSSQWPALDPLVSKRRPTLRQKNSSTACCCEAKKPIYGVIDGPIVTINNRNTPPVEYFSTYQGKIEPKAVAIISRDGVSHSYEKINLLSDHLAKVLKPMVEEELAKIFDALTEDPSLEPCIGIARNPCEICIAALLAVWKLGLPYLPIRTFENPPWRITTIIATVKPLMIIGMAADQTLEEATKDCCRLLTYEGLWELGTLKNKQGEKPLSQNERNEHFKVKKLEELRKLREEFDPSLRCITIFHRFNGDGNVVTTHVRTVTIWNRLQAEWTAFPYTKKEKVVVHSPVDSQEFLGQFLAPLLGGHTMVIVDAHDMYGFLQTLQNFKLRRLTVFPELLYGMVKVMQLIYLLKNKSNSPTELNFFDTVKYWFVTGCAIRYEMGNSFFNHAPKGSVLINLLDSRELLTFVCFEVFKSKADLKDGLYYEILTMGKPVMNTRVYILDQSDHIAGSSALGEIYVSGPGTTLSPQLIRGSFTQKREELAPVAFQNPFLGEEKNKQKKEMFGVILRTKEYGRLIYRDKHSGCPNCCRNKITLQYAGNEDGEIIIESYRVNTNEIVAHLKSCPVVKSCHVMVYRPGTTSKAILAFITAKQQVTKEEIHLFLRTRIPEYLIPTIIIIPGLPVKDHRINTTELVDSYLKDRVIKKRTYDDWKDLLGMKMEPDSKELKAAKSLCETLYYTCGIAEEWAAVHFDWTLTELRIPFTSVPAIYKELIRQGYDIGMKEFFGAKRVQDIFDMMVKHSPLPAPKVALQLIESSHLYSNEVITNAHKKDIVKFFLYSNNYGTSNKKTLMQYCGLSNQDMEKLIVGVWPLIVYRNYSIVVREKATKKIVASLLNADCRDKAYCQQWQIVSQQHPTKYRLGMIDEVDESLANQGLINPKYSMNGMQVLFFMYDVVMVSNFERSLQILELLFTKAIQVAKVAGFRSLHVTIYDYVFAGFLTEAFNFEVMEYKQANQYEARDGTKPFQLAPDHITGIVLYKLL